MFFKIIPIFQVNTKFLAPLFLAYDDRLKEKEQLIKTYDVSLRDKRQDIDGSNAE